MLRGLVPTRTRPYAYSYAYILALSTAPSVQWAQSRRASRQPGVNMYARYVLFSGGF